MTHASGAPRALWVAAMLCSSAARAGVWGMDPSVGASADYASNPVLLDIPHTTEADVALLVDLPTTYTGDGFSLSLLPSFRVSDRSSYASLNSNYAHLTATGELDSDLNKLTLTLGATQDSSLYENYLVDGESAVRRDGLTGDLTWTRHLSELLDADLDVDTMRARYGTASGNASLVDYNDTAVSPDLKWTRSELDSITFSASAGQYDAVRGTTSSKTLSGQLGYTRALSELWSLNVSAGYTRSQNQLNVEEPEYVFTGNGIELIEVPIRIESQLDSPTYAVHLTRTGERLTLNLSASRLEVPTGFAFLSRQTLYDFQATYTISPRWSASLHEYHLSASDPSGVQGEYENRNVNTLTLDGTYQLTEQLTLDVALSRVDETYQASHLDLASNQLTLTLTQKFNHIDFQ
jgi:hypothetical protein